MDNDEVEKSNPRIEKLVRLLIKRAIIRMELEDTEKLVEAFSRRMSRQEVDIARSIYRRKVIKTFRDATKKTFEIDNGVKNYKDLIEKSISPD